MISQRSCIAGASSAYGVRNALLFIVLLGGSIFSVGHQTWQDSPKQCLGNRQMQTMHSAL